LLVLKKTSVKKKTLDPVWDKGEADHAKLQIAYNRAWNDKLFLIEVWDKDVGLPDDRIGYCSICFDTLFEKGPGELELKVHPVKKEKATGTITILIA